jgi:putative ABC transport system substrate-binding protein
MSARSCQRRAGLALTFMLALSILAAPLAAGAQQTAGKVYRLGILSPGAGSGPSVPSIADLLLAVLREHGYVERRNLVVERRFADDKPDRLPGLARELVHVRPDIIVALSGLAIQAARDATTTIPIVMVIAADPVTWGLVASLSRPGGNVTGITINYETTLAGKRLELLKEAVPRAVRVAVLGSGPLSSSAQLREAEKAAGALGIKLVPVEIQDNDYDRAFAAIVAERADAILILTGPTVVRDGTRIIDRTLKHRLPAISALRDFVEAGALMSYGGSNLDMSRRVAVYVDKILKGAKPADLPVEQPTTFELAINLKTAKVLGLKIPESLLQRADEVIQ